MQIYLVGGAVRDFLLGIPVKDRDWAVVGATPSEMISRGFTQVGRDFPVFLHPETKEEYALARTERKSGRGYKGFEVYADTSVSIFDDLQRRDLTINALAVPATFLREDFSFDEKDVIDPCGGLIDLRGKVLRHVSDAFDEDPLRIFRIARFAARFQEFSIAEETQNRLKKMVAVGEINFLSSERIYGEISRALMEKAPHRFFEVLNNCGALITIMPDFDFDKAIFALKKAVNKKLPEAARWACIARGEKEYPKIKIPIEYKQLAQLAARQRGNFEKWLNTSNISSVEYADLFNAVDLYRKPERFHLLLETLSCDINNQEEQYQALAKQIKKASIAAQTTNTKEVVQQAMQKEVKNIAKEVYKARIKSIQKAMEE